MSVPKLRFKEFKGEWEDKKIKDFLISHKGGAPLTPSDFVKISDYEVIPKKAISSGGNLSLSLSEGTFCSEIFFNKNLKSVVDDSYLITTLRDLVPSGPTIGYIVKFKSDKSYILAQGVYGIKIDKNLNELFLIHYSNTDKYRVMMQTMMVGSTQVHIRNNDFFETPIKTPSLSEQTKIADFLTTVDEKITQLTQKYELLARYKKGVMQKLFSQELRFKDDGDRNFPDWEEDSLLNLSESGFTNGVFNDPTKVGRGYKLINVLDMYIDSTIDDTKLNLVELSEDEFNRNKVKYGDIFFTRSSLVKEGIAHSNIYLGSSQDVTFDGHLIRMSPKKDLLNPMFFYYLLKTSKVRKQFVKRGKTTTMTTIGQADIATVILDFPLITEQIKIASFLNTIDDKIAEDKTYLETVKQYKQALLQQMFI